MVELKPEGYGRGGRGDSEGGQAEFVREDVEDKILQVDISMDVDAGEDDGDVTPTLSSMAEPAIGVTMDWAEPERRLETFELPSPPPPTPMKKKKAKTKCPLVMRTSTYRSCHQRRRATSQPPDRRFQRLQT